MEKQVGNCIILQMKILSDMCRKVISYVTTSDRCLTNGILRNEGPSMDQSIFKAVLIPYIVNLALDEAANSTLRQNLILFLRKMQKH